MHRKNLFFLLIIALFSKQALALTSTPSYVALFQDAKQAKVRIQTEEPIWISTLRIIGTHANAFSVELDASSTASVKSTASHGTTLPRAVIPGQTFEVKVNFHPRPDILFPYQAWLRMEGYTQRAPNAPVVLEVPLRGAVVPQDQDVLCDTTTRIVNSHPAVAIMPPPAWICFSRSRASFQFTAAKLTCDPNVPAGLFTLPSGITQHPIEAKQDARVSLAVQVPASLAAGTYTCTVDLQDDRGGTHQAKQMLVHSDQPAQLWCDNDLDYTGRLSLVTNKNGFSFPTLAPRQTQRKSTCKLIPLDAFRIQTWNVTSSTSDFTSCKDESSNDTEVDAMGVQTPLLHLCFTPQHRGQTHRAEATVSYTYQRLGETATQQAMLRIPLQGSTGFKTSKQGAALSTCGGYQSMPLLFGENDKALWEPLDAIVEGPDASHFNVDIPHGVELHFDWNDETRIVGKTYRATVKLWLANKKNPRAPGLLRIFSVDGEIESSSTCSDRANRSHN